MKPRYELHKADCLAWLKTLADNSVDSIVTDLAAGHAAEHLVCADLLMKGLKAFLSDQICPYDVAVDLGGQLLRVQVKATRAPRSIPQRASHFPAYMWHVRRAGKKGKRTYGEGEFDLLALVALDVRQIAYLPPSSARQTVHIRPDDGRPNSSRRGKRFEDFTFEAATMEVFK